MGGIVSHIDVFKGWAETIRQDIDAFKALLESTKADANTQASSPVPRCSTWSAGWT